MDQYLKSASLTGDIDSLYAFIRQNPYLLAQIEDIPFVDTPLHVAAYAGQIKFAMEIMRLKPSFAWKSNPDGFSPTHIALQNNHTELVLRLVDTDIELVRVKGREGITPFHYVAEKGNKDLLDHFLSICPKSIEDVTITNETALHVCLKSSSFDVFEFLVGKIYKDCNKDTHKILNCKDENGNTVLHVATSRRQPQALEVLKGYDRSNPGVLQVDTRNKNDQTAMDLAYDSNYGDIMELLRQIDAERASNLDSISLENVQPTTSTAADSLAAPAQKLSRDDIVQWDEYFKFEFEKGDPNKVRGDLLVVAVLMATSTYQTGLQPPGGLNDNKLAVLSAHTFSYVLFMCFNSIGFFVSLNIILVLINNYPMFGDINVAIGAMTGTYVAAIATISPPGSTRILLMVLSMLMPIAIFCISFKARKCIKQRKRRNAYRSRENA